MKTIPSDIHEQVVLALRELQGMDDSSINSLAAEIGVKSTWLHLVKNNASGQKTVNNIVKVYNHLVTTVPSVMRPRAASVGQAERGRELKVFDEREGAGL